MSRRSSTSFLSCMEETEGGATEQQQTGLQPDVGQQPSPDKEEAPALKFALQRHALLEFVLGICWGSGASSGFSRRLYHVFESNRFSKFLNPARQDKASVCLPKTVEGLSGSLYWRRLRIVSLDKYRLWISGAQGSSMEDDTTSIESGTDMECRRYLDSNVAESLMWDCITEELNSEVSDEVIGWLASIHNRSCLSFLEQNMATSRLIKVMQQDGGTGSLNEDLETIQTLSVNFAGLLLASPSVFGYPKATLEPSKTYKYLHSFIIRNFKRAYLLAVLESMTDSISASEMDAFFTGVWGEIYAQLLGRRLYKNDTSLLTVITTLLQEKSLATALVKSNNFLPIDGHTTGWGMMMDTFFGRLFRPSPMDYMRTGDEPPDFVSVCDKHFSNLIIRGSAAHYPVNAIHLVRSNYLGITQSNIQIIKTLLKHGDECKSKTLAWFASILETNIIYGSIGFRHNQAIFVEMGAVEMLSYRAQQVSTPPFGLNIVLLLLMLCEPIALTKIADLNPFYPEYCKKDTVNGKLLGLSLTKEARMIDEKSIIDTGEKLVEKLSDADFKFTCQIFWLTLKAIGIFLLPAYDYNELKHRRLSKALEAKEDKENLLAEMMAWSCFLQHDHFINSLSHFCELTASVFLRSAFAFDSQGAPLAAIGDNHQVPQALQQINVNLQLLPQAKTPPPQYALLPYSYFADFFSIISKTLTASATPIFAATRVDSAEHFMGATNHELLAACVLFILRDPSNYIRSVGLKLEAAAHILLAISIMKTMPHRFASTTCVKNAMAPSLITAFVEAQKASYYQRIDLRLLLTREFERFLPQQHFQNQLTALSKTNSEEYERFIHFFASNTSWVLEEALSSLSEVKKRETKESGSDLGALDVDADMRNRARDRGEGENDETRDIAAEMEGTRNVADMPFQSLANHCKGLMEAGQLSLNVLRLLVNFSADFIKTSDVLLPQMVLYLNSCLNSLVGPKCLTLKVTNFEVYNFKPRELLASLAFIYVSLAKNGNSAQAEANFDEQVVACICSEDRYFQCELFAKASRILQREGIVSKQLLEDFRALNKAITEKYKETKFMDDLMMTDDVPSEYLDPLMAEIMRDPVLLPSSGVIVERRVIERHLISDEFDPFNRAPLKRSDLIPQPELKQQIQEFIEKRKKQENQS